MITHLLDTNVCIFFNKGVGQVRDRLDEVGFDRCAISEITYAELLYGVEKSEHQSRNLKTLKLFMLDLQILTISTSIVLFAKEKARLKRIGQPVDNFDLLIGATAIHHNLVLVTNNTKHFQRLHDIQLEDWTK
ncbi:MAG: PIN domain-containing protein [Flavobacteriales bacterium]